MKKCIFAILLFSAFIGTSFAEDAVTPAADAVATKAETVAAETASAVNSAIGSATETVAPEASVAATTATEVAVEPAPTAESSGENLEFISGEVSTLDDANKSLTVKLYGETENTPGEKSITVTVDASTDITDGEKDRDLKSLTAGTEVDVEYDPANNKATYIFVY